MSEETLRAKEALRHIPGHVSLREGDEYRERASIGLADALSGMPGVYVQRPSGQEAARISMRGSGISSTSIRGIRLLRDGLPLGRLDDMNEAIAADTMTAQRIEVYRGAASLAYGISALGGAINLISPTARNDGTPTARFELGSDGFRRAQLKGGKVWEQGLDAYVSLTHYENDTFRQNAAERSSRLYANLGYQFSATSRGRFHLTEERYTGGLPGTITLDQLQRDPSAANANNRRANASIHTSPRWHVAYQHELDLGDQRLSAGIFHTGTKFDSPTPAARALYDAVDYGFSLRHEIPNFGAAGNRFVWGVNGARGNGDNRLLPAPPPFTMPGTTGAVKDRRSTVALFAENTYQFADRWALVTGAQWRRDQRRTENQTPALLTQYPNGSASRTYESFDPKLGLIWDLDEARRTQLYANLSRSHETPASLTFFTKLPPAQPTTLDAQRATTFEVGMRGGDQKMGWDVALYRSRVSRELLVVANAISPVLPPININSSSDTEHSGLELGLHGNQALPSLQGSLDWNLAYTWNHFRFDGHTTYGDNKLPGIPDHVLQAGFTYRHVDGFYIGPRMELGSNWYADQANTLKAPGYGVLHLQAGYLTKTGYRFFVDARNLGDKHYASTADILVNASAASTSTAVFRPGQVRAVFAGVEKRW
ncbi:TonB-dependent receptor [uncultured Oxalicibacterium sp.]|uniref:TonB-dependent receptor family protein n=1 Tax=uncultured Oxalicibacterium sp. TaxID=1168540 RepID=UPI0025D95895|nr:TonB-dependent receptor [uncultured Oxalicibacterium sp.]